MAAEKWARVQYRVGRAVAWLGWHGGAAQIFREALADDPLLLDAQYSLCDALMAGERWAEAAVAVRDLAQQVPASVEIQGNLVLCLARAGAHEATIEALDRMIRLRPFQPELHLLKGALFRRRRQHGEAIRAFRWAVSLGHSATVAHFQLGEAVLGLEHWQTLLQRYRSALAVPCEASVYEASLSALNAPPLPVLDPVDADGGSAPAARAVLTQAPSPPRRLGLRVGEWGQLLAGRWQVLLYRHFRKGEPHLAIRRYRRAWALRSERLGKTASGTGQHGIGDLAAPRAPVEGGER